MGQLQDLAARLAIPGLPEWTGLLALILLALVGLAYLLMPFAVFGVKGRLDVVEAQLDEIQAEIRNLSLRLGESPRRAASATMATDEWVEPPPRRPAAEEASAPRVTPPVPPPAAWPEGRAVRAEPRLDWPGRGGRA